MSDDDMVRRGDVRREFADYCAAAGDDFNRTLDRVPAVPTSPAERLARAAETWQRLLHLTHTAGDDSFERASEEFMDALAAFRAAKPDSTGAAPPAAEPAPLQKPPGSCDEGAVRANNPEPAKEPEPCGTCGGSPRRGCSGACDDGKPCADVCPKCGAA